MHGLVRIVRIFSEIRERQEEDSVPLVDDIRHHIDQLYGEAAGTGAAAGKGSGTGADAGAGAGMVVAPPTITTVSARTTRLLLLGGIMQEAGMKSFI